MKEDRNGGKPHERTVARAVRMGASRQGRSCAHIGGQAFDDCFANTECPAYGAVMSVLKPAHITVHLIAGVKASRADKAVRKTERHGGVVRPVSWGQFQSAASSHVHDRFESPGKSEFNRRPERIADGKAEQGASAMIFNGNGWKDHDDSFAIA